MKSEYLQMINFVAASVFSIFATSSSYAYGSDSDSDSVNVTSMDGWWTASKGEGRAGSINHANVNVFYRRNGKSYLVNSSNCKVLQVSQIEYDESKTPFTGRIKNRKTGSTTFFSYTQDNDVVLMAIYLDDRREHKSPSQVSQNDNVRLIRQTRMTEIMCDDPESGARSKITYKPKVDCDENQISFWANNCQDINSSRSFMMQCGKRKYPIKIGNSIKAIPYPGLQDVIDVYSDPRIKWLSDEEISVSNFDKNSGWMGQLTFNRCKVLR